MVPEGWKDACLGELMEFKNGLNTEKENYGSGTKFVNVMDVFRNDRLYEQNIMGSVQVNGKQLSDYAVRYGDILFNRTSETFDEIAMSSVYLDSKEITFGGFVIRGRPKSQDLFPEFSVFCFQSWQVRKELIRRGQGAVRANIGQKDLCKIPVPVPPLPEQKKIARILSTWDRAIEVTENLLKNSQKQKKSLMQQLLTGKKRLPGFSGEWRRVKLKSLCSIKTGKKDVNEGNPRGLYPFYTCAKEPTYSDKYSFDCEALLIAGNGALGTTHYFNGKFEAYQRTYVLNEFSHKIYISFLHQFVLYWLSRDIEREKQHGAMPYIKLGLLQSFKVLVPLIDEQQKITSVLSAADKEIEILEQKLQCFRQEKKALMQQLLTGKRRVQVDEDDIPQKTAARA